MIPGAQLPMNFQGSTYEPERDQQRLSGQMLRVYVLMKDGRWRTLSAIVQGIGGHASEVGVSARLRDLRKERYGAHTVERRYLHDGLFEYRLLIRKESA